MENFLRVGVIANTHGIRGEVKVYPTTDDNRRFEDLKNVLLDTGKEPLPMEIESVRYFKQMVILKFKGYDSINEIEKYKGRDLLITREQAVPLDEDEYFIFDIIGAQVITDEGAFLGNVVEVLATGANDVYVVRGNGEKEILIPVIKDCVKEIDIERKKVAVHLIPGLLDS